jgi:hypothetical protein
MVLGGLACWRAWRRAACACCKGDHYQHQHPLSQHTRYGTPHFTTNFTIFNFRFFDFSICSSVRFGHGDNSLIRILSTDLLPPTHQIICKIGRKRMFALLLFSAHACNKKYSSVQHGTVIRFASLSFPLFMCFLPVLMVAG